MLVLGKLESRWGEYVNVTDQDFHQYLLLKRAFEQLNASQLTTANIQLSQKEQPEARSMINELRARKPAYYWGPPDEPYVVFWYRGDYFQISMNVGPVELNSMVLLVPL